jgi:hypothetical protein
MDEGKFLGTIRSDVRLESRMKARIIFADPIDH